MFWEEVMVASVTVTFTPRTDSVGEADADGCEVALLPPPQAVTRMRQHPKKNT